MRRWPTTARPTSSRTSREDLARALDAPRGLLRVHGHADSLPRGSSVAGRRQPRAPGGRGVRGGTRRSISERRADSIGAGAGRPRTGARRRLRRRDAAAVLRLRPRPASSASRTCAGHHRERRHRGLDALELRQGAVHLERQRADAAPGGARAWPSAGATRTRASASVRSVPPVAQRRPLEQARPRPRAPRRRRRGGRRGGAARPRRRPGTGRPGPGRGASRGDAREGPSAGRTPRTEQERCHAGPPGGPDNPLRERAQGPGSQAPSSPAGPGRAT